MYPSNIEGLGGGFHPDQQDIPNQTKKENSAPLGESPLPIQVTATNPLSQEVKRLTLRLKGLPLIENPVIKHLKSPAEVAALTITAYAGITLSSNLFVPALNNLVEVLNKTVGK